MPEDMTFLLRRTSTCWTNT